MHCEPNIKGVRRDDLGGYADELGSVYVGGAGHVPEPGFCFYYRDTKYEFCFYADSKYEGSSYDVEVTMRNTDRFSGPSVEIDPEELDRITRNMRRFFSDRCFLMLRKPVPAGEHFRSLKMFWRP